MNTQERAKVVALLQPHPHAVEFLKGDRPANIPEDEWVFLRAATWADWVRSGPPARRAFHKATHHYVNTPFVHPPGSVTPPAPPAETILTALAAAKQEATAGSAQDKRAVAVCWLFHLVGDVHQPMHCATLFGPKFPDGDRGGNRSLFRVGNRRVQMHSFWDGLLGQATTLASIGTSVQEAEAALQGNTAAADDLAGHTTFASWVEEGFEAAKRFAYLNGVLAVENSENDPETSDLDEAPGEYAADAGRAARVAVGKAGKRLAAVLREVVAAN